MSELKRQLLHRRLQSDLKTFIHRTFQTVAPQQVYRPNWHIDAMSYHLQQCAVGKIKRLLITLPPRNLKSICASVAFPAWLLGQDPSQRIICASYSEGLASQFSLDCRRVVKSDWYARVFPHTRINPEKNTELNFQTTRQGYRYATSVSGTLTGIGGNLIILDDLLKPDDALSDVKRSAVNQWFDRTLYSRLDDKRSGVIVAIMQRLHLEDLAGHLLRKGGWVHLDLPAIAENEERIQIGPNEYHTRAVGELLHTERESHRELDDAKANMGSFKFSAQYQQNPLPPEGEIIKWSGFQFYDVLPPPEPGDEMVQSWDTACKAEQLSDYSVCETFLVRGNKYYLVDVLRQKLDYPALKQKVIAHARNHRAGSVIIEDKGSGTSLIQDLRQGGGAGDPMPIAFEPEGDKITRMYAQCAKIEAGQVLLPRSAAWVDEFRSELLQFPHGRHDDQVDSLSQFLGWVGKRSERTRFEFDFGFEDPPAIPDPFYSLARLGR